MLYDCACAVALPMFGRCQGGDGTCWQGASSGACWLQGEFAQAQAQFLQPDREQVEQLAAVLSEKKIGIVAHFYMDPEVCAAAPPHSSHPA